MNESLRHGPRCRAGNDVAHLATRRLLCDSNVGVNEQRILRCNNVILHALTDIYGAYRVLVFLKSGNKLLHLGLGTGKAAKLLSCGQNTNCPCMA